MEPIEQVLRVGVEVELELPDGVPAIGEEGDLLVQLMALRLEHLVEPPFRFLVIGLDEGKAFAGHGGFGLLTPREGQEALPSDDLKPASRALGTDIAPIEADGERTI